jgi:hypothetical protein
LQSLSAQSTQPAVFFAQSLREERPHCTVIAMQDGGTGAGVQHGGAGREANLIFVVPPNVYVGPSGRGTFCFQIFIQAPSLEIWRKTISGAEGGSGEEVGWPVWATSLEKIIGGVTVIISSAQRSSLPCRGVLSLRSEAREASGSETARFHHAARRRGHHLAARGEPAGIGEHHLVDRARFRVVLGHQSIAAERSNPAPVQLSE